MSYRQKKMGFPLPTLMDSWLESRQPMYEERTYCKIIIKIKIKICLIQIVTIYRTHQ